jgi:hypothetical protein
VTRERILELLQTYTVTELLEMGGMDEVDALYVLYELEELQPPEFLPL